MQMNPYLIFNGDCEAAFKFYEQSLGGKIEMMLTHGNSPMAEQTTPEWRHKIMHAALVVGNNMLGLRMVRPATTRKPGVFTFHWELTIPPKPSAYSRYCRKMGQYKCRWRKHSGPFDSACWLISLARHGWLTARKRNIRDKPPAAH